jgi:hypothetical protein
MSQRSHKEPNDFSQKIRHQGKAGFGAGPWSDPAKIGVKTRPESTPPRTDRTRPDAPLVRSGKHAPCRLGDRILTGLAILSLGMLIVGAMGAYLSNDSQRVATTTRGDDAAPAALLASSDARFMALENRLTQINDLYGQRLSTLESKLEQTVDPYEARLTTLENRLETSGEAAADSLQNDGISQAQFDAPAYEARLAALENRLEQAYVPYQAELRDMENRMGQGYAGYDARLREMESRLMQIQIPYGKRLQALEQQLIYASARLDYLSAEMQTLIDNNATVVEASATLQRDPPAALPVDGAGSLRSPSSMDDSAATPETGQADMEDPVAPADVTLPVDTGLSQASQPSMDTLDETSAVIVQANGASDEPQETGELQAGEADTPPPIVARAETTQPLTRPVEAARGIPRDNTSGSGGTGDWVINLASYASESIAAHKLADFRRKGVTAEQAVASVNGKTIYRVRLAGFESRKSAVDQAETVRQQLGLKETWITRQ